MHGPPSLLALAAKAGAARRSANWVLHDGAAAPSIVPTQDTTSRGWAGPVHSSPPSVRLTSRPARSPQRAWLRPTETLTNDPFRHSLGPTSNLGLFCHLPGRRPPGLFEGPEDDSLEEASWDDPEDTSPEA